MNYKVTFIILHYITTEDTLECVKSIIDNIKYNRYEIIIVDNGSPNKSGIKLKEIFEDNSNVRVEINEKNLGFAKGNNVGFKIAKEDLNSDFVIMLNNDTILKQPDFINVLIEKYKNDKFSVLGPDIISTIDGNHQNPHNSPQRASLIKYTRTFLIYLFLLIMNYIHLDEKILNLRGQYKAKNEAQREKDLKPYKRYDKRSSSRKLFSLFSNIY
jgi:GT2 family glycosyltransferase